MQLNTFFPKEFLEICVRAKVSSISDGAHDTRGTHRTHCHWRHRVSVLWLVNISTSLMLDARSHTAKPS